jgi:hypothetical protein
MAKRTDPDRTSKTRTTVSPTQIASSMPRSMTNIRFLGDSKRETGRRHLGVELSATAHDDRRPVEVNIADSAERTPRVLSAKTKLMKSGHILRKSPRKGNAKKADHFYEATSPDWVLTAGYIGFTNGHSCGTLIPPYSNAKQPSRTDPRGLLFNQVLSETTNDPDQSHSTSERVRTGCSGSSCGRKLGEHSRQSSA